MDAVPEGKVMVDLPMDVEPFAVGELAVVAVRRTVEEEQGAALGDVPETGAFFTALPPPFVDLVTSPVRAVARVPAAG